MAEQKRKGMPPRRKMIIILLAVGFAAIEFPGILLIGDLVYPRLFGFPFLYGYLILCWCYMAAVLFYAWRTGWGRRPFTLQKGSD